MSQTTSTSFQIYIMGLYYVIQFQVSQQAYKIHNISFVGTFFVCNKRTCLTTTVSE